MINEFPNDFFLPDGKNSRISQIINKWIFGRQMPDGYEGIGVEIPYLECAHSTKYYVIDQINGNICTIHDNKIKPTDSFGCLRSFNLKELEFNVCRIADHCNNVDDSRLDDNRRHVPQEVPTLQKSAQPRQLRPFHELKDMVHDSQVFSMEYCTNLYFYRIEVINNLVESFQMYSTHILNNPLSAPEYRTKQSEQASYYEKIIKNINVFLQMDQVYHICEGLPQVPPPRYVLT